MNRLAFSGFVAVLLGTFFAIHLSCAHAEDNDDATYRASVIQSIHYALTTVMVRQLSQARDDDSDDSIQVAIRVADGMEDNVHFLDGVKGTDKTAEAIVERYPGYIDQFLEAANALVKLKNAQLRQNKKMLWKLCAEQDENLQRAVKQYVEPPDPVGVDKLPELAGQARDQIHDEFSRQLDQVNEISRAHDDAKAFSISVGGWSDVTSQMRNATDGIWGIYDAQLKKTRDKCTDLDKGMDNPLLIEAMAKLPKVARHDAPQPSPTDQPLP